MEAHDFDLKPVLIFLVRKSQLDGTTMERPNMCLSMFLQVYDTLKINNTPVTQFAYSRFLSY